jgi:nicotinamidase-related amidase
MIQWLCKADSHLSRFGQRGYRARAKVFADNLSERADLMARTVLWEVDVQRDFMLRGGALYVEGAERLIPNIAKLVNLARNGYALLISSACQHTVDDPEFQVFPPHCVRGTTGAELLPEARTDKILTVPSDARYILPGDIRGFKQILFEKQNIDVFTNPHVATVLSMLPDNSRFFVFGVVTEYCVRMAASGLLESRRQTALVTDATEMLNRPVGQETLSELVRKGARLVETEAVCEEVLGRRILESHDVEA